MLKILLIILLLSLSPVVNGQGSINVRLKNELDSIFKEDQHYRHLLSSPLLLTRADSLASVYNIPKDQLIMHLIRLSEKIDSSNLVAIEKIIQTYGYPGKTLVGTPTNEAAFFVIQHSQKIDKYLPLVKKAAQKKELSFTLYAMMLDRSLMYKNKEQVYGTQAQGLEVYNPFLYKREFTRVTWPIKDPATVNKRRQQAGFTETVEENAKRLGVAYKVLSVQDILAMRSKQPAELTVEFLTGVWMNDSTGEKIECKIENNRFKLMASNSYVYEFFTVTALPINGTTISWPPHGCVIRKVDDTHIEVEYEIFGQKPYIYRYKKLLDGKSR